MKKFTSLILALALCMGLAVPAFAAEYGPVSVETEYGVVTFEAAMKGEATTVKFEVPGTGELNDAVYVPITLKPGSNLKVDATFGVPYIIYGVSAEGALFITSLIDYFYADSTDSVDVYFNKISPEDNYNHVLWVWDVDGTDYLVKLGDGTATKPTAATAPTAATEPTAATAPTAPNFTDVTAGAYYADAVKWAVEKGITAGTTTTTFSPDNTCTTAQILTFLWRANGSPAPAGNNAAVPAGQYYTDAANWALEKGLTDDFSADTPATRAATVTYLWKLAGKPAAEAAAFTDVDASAEYAQAVAWAVKEGITAGTSATTFAPDNTCTRGQIATFLHRSLA